jgi:hypothetical protein
MNIFSSLSSITVPATSPVRPPKLLALGLALALLLSGCGGGSDGAAGPPLPVAGPPVTLSPSAGVVELEIAGIGTGAVTSSLSFDGVAALRARALAAGSADSPASVSNGVADGSLARSTPQVVTNLATGLDIQLQSASSIDVGTRGVDGMRYISATYRIRNAQFCSTPGTCAVYATARQNLTFLAVITGSTINQSAVSRFTRFDGSAASAALATQLVPTHGMNTTATGVEAERASLQVYRESELPATDPSAVSVLPYGFVVRNVNDGSRTLAANPAANQFDGRVTFAFRIPLQPSATEDPFKVSLRFQIAEDSSTRVTQSLQEASFTGDTNAAARAAALGATDLVVPCGRLSQARNGNPICDVRIAGLAGSATATTMGAAPASPQVVSAPSNLIDVPTDTSVVLGMSAAMNSPSAATLVVDGSQSGRRTLTGAYAGALDGGGSTGKPNQLIFKLNPGDRPFFRGETVSFVGTAGNTAAVGGAAMVPFAGGFLTKGSVSGGAGGFATPPQYPVGADPQAVVLGDLNGDGWLDAVSANVGSNDVSVLLGNAVGGFGLAASFAVGSRPVSVALGDVNGDGKLDIVAANQGDGTVSVLLGNGVGAFGASTSFAVGTFPESLALGDVNGDGRPDIVTAHSGSNSVAVLLGSGSGSFGSAMSMAVGTNPVVLALVDVNRDGRLDIISGNLEGGLGADGSVSVLLATGSGGFAAAATYPAGRPVNALTFGDVNRDGYVDLVTSTSVLTGDGSGAFGATAHFGSSTFPSCVALADLDGDGALDVVVPGLLGQGLAVRLGTGTGGFGAAVNFSLGNGTRAIVIGDINKDGRLDIVAAGGNGTVAVANGNGAGAFDAIAQFATGSQQNSAVALGDLNGDGRLDLVLSNEYENSVSVMLGQTTGGFAAAVSYSVGSVPFRVRLPPPPGFSYESYAVVSGPFSLALADVNADGKLDVVTANWGTDSISVLLGDGAGTLGAPTLYAVGSMDRRPSLALADLNGDGRLDLVTQQGFLALGDGAGGFGGVSNWPLASGASSVASGDLDGDGRLDLISIGSPFTASGVVSVRLASVAGGFQPQTIVAVPGLPTAVALADVDGDGRLDVVVTLREFNLGPGPAPAGGRVTVLLGTGTGALSSPTSYPVTITPGAALLADFNGDGRLDIILTDSASGSVAVLLGSGAGGFGSPAIYTGANASIAVGDITGDGRLDVVTAVSGVVSLLRGR